MDRPAGPPASTGPAAWIQGGFFLVAPSPPRARPLLPDSLVTVSTCIAETYPSADAPPSDLALGDSRFWPPDVFLDSAAAREFHRGALAGRRGIRLIGISLHPAELDRWLANEGFAATAVEDGVSRALERRRPAGDAGVVLGYDVLGHDVGSFHSFVCNGLEAKFASDLGIRFNAHGLIDDDRQAAAAAAFANRPDVGAEPVDWYAFRVDEYPL